ncbi:MAG: hypothetical protein R3F19_13050 [Verrucomicrobiales bacterium]
MAENVAQIADLKEENWSYATPEFDTFVKSVTIGIDGGRANFREEGWRDVMVGTSQSMIWLGNVCTPYT